MGFRKIALLVMVLVMGMMISPTAAQDGSQPFQRMLLLISETNNPRVISGYGDIYTWEPGGALIRETTYGYNDVPVLSPDGTKAVYLSLPSSYIEAWWNGTDLTQGMGPLPANIWMMYMTTSLDDPLRFVRIADQTTGLPPGSEMVRRSRPVWSPDSALVAWLEKDVTVDSFSGRIVIYDTRTGTTQIAAQGLSLGFADAGMWGIPNLIGWGSHLAHVSMNAGVYPDQNGPGFGETLDLVAATGAVSTTPVSYFANFEDQLTEIRWVQHNGQWRVALQYPNLGWVIFDPAANTYERLQNPPVARAITGQSWMGRPSDMGMQWYNADGAYTVTNDAPFTFSASGVPFWLTPGGYVSTSGDLGVPLIAPSFAVKGIAWIPEIWLTDGIATPIQPSIAVG